MDEARTTAEYTSESIRARPSDESVIDLSQFFKFPSLNQLFQNEDRSAIAELRARLKRTGESLDRVIRTGAKADADRAALVSRSYVLTLTVLDELERHVVHQKK